MALRVSRLAHPAALAAPDQETREQGLKALRLELEGQNDDRLAALLSHEIARLHERREDLASAARDELATTKKAAGFVEPIESLIDIATRSRSKANLAKLLGRLTKLARGDDEKLRASLALALTHLASDDTSAALTTIEEGLEAAPAEPALWIALETLAAETGDTALLLKAATGRAAHAQDDEIRCLLLERAARLHVELGDAESAFAALRQSVEEIPSWRALHTWEELGVRAENYDEASQAASQTATILRAGLEEPEEAKLYQVPDEELSEERSVAAHIRAIIYAIRGGDEQAARGLGEQLCDAAPDSALAQALLAELCLKQGDTEGATDALTRLIESRKWNSGELAVLQCLAALTTLAGDDEDGALQLLEQLRNNSPQSRLPQIQRWLAAEQSENLEEFGSLLQDWAAHASAESEDEPKDTSFISALCLVKMVMGDLEGARALVETSHETNSAVPALLGYVLEQLTEQSDRRPTLPSDIGSEKDQRALSWEAARQGLVGSGPEVSEDQLDDAWAKVVLSLRKGDFTGTPLGWDEEVSNNHAVGDSSNAAEPAERAETDHEEGEAPPQTPPSKLGEAELRGDEPDGVIASLTEESAEPAEVAPAVGTDTSVDEDADGAEDSDNADGTDAEGGQNTGQVSESIPAAKTNSTVPPAPPTGARAIVESYLVSTGAPVELSGALRAHLLAGAGQREDLQRLWACAPGDPLLAGALCSLLETGSLQEAQGGASLYDTRRKSAEHLEDETLRGAWLLKSAADALELGQAEDAISAIEESGAVGLDNALGPWFVALRGGTDPKSRLEAFKNSPPLGDDQLEYATLAQRWAPEELSDFDAENPSPALQILQVLHRATGPLEALEYALDDTQLFTEEERAALPLARRFTPDESASLLEAARRWNRQSPSISSHVALWIAGTRAADFDAQRAAIASLATDLNNATLLTAVPAAQLDKSGREAHQEQLESLRAAQEETGQNSPVLNWVLTEQLPDEITDRHAEELSKLGRSLDPGLSDPDAQAALLLSGFEYLTLERYEEALEIFEPLLELLPGDLTLCQGTRLAASVADRPDLEAQATCELAKATEDGLKSAALWERAGVLFQDVLEDPEEAEKCFTSALGRSPGSRLSFERVYRFARDRNDRQRQVELIDARLDTAESESLQIDLYWEKARFCRMLGRRAVALRSLEELLGLAPDHLPALALCAELHLVDGRIDAAAETLKAVAKHPDTPTAQRSAAGLHACDLYEQLRKPREAVELLQVLDEYGVSGNAGLERRARSLARSEDWGQAYSAFADLNGEQDEIETRLESARMMLAIQRDHLKDPEELKRSARAVLRDDPLDGDAILVVLEHEFPPEERQRLLDPARRQSLEALRRNPLNPPEISRFAGLCYQCGDEVLERIALGNLGLTGKLSEEYAARLNQLLTSCQTMPTAPLSRGDLEALSDPLQLGSAGRYIQLISPYLAEALDPSLDALGVSSLMRTDEFSGSAHRAEIGTWVGCFGDNDFELYVGGSSAQLIRGLHGDLPTLLVGKEVASPLTAVDRARIVAQLSALHYNTVTFLNHPAEILEKWVIASEILAGRKSSPDTAGEIDEMARKLSRRIPREVREEITLLREELTRAGVNLSQAPYVIQRGAARAAALAHGEANIIRQLSHLLPADQELLNRAMADLVRFVLSEEFMNIRRKIGLEGV